MVPKPHSAPKHLRDTHTCVAPINSGPGFDMRLVGKKNNTQEQKRMHSMKCFVVVVLYDDWRCKCSAFCSPCCLGTSLRPIRSQLVAPKIRSCPLHLEPSSFCNRQGGFVRSAAMSATRRFFACGVDTGLHPSLRPNCISEPD